MKLRKILHYLPGGLLLGLILAIAGWLCYVEFIIPILAETVIEIEASSLTAGRQNSILKVWQEAGNGVVRLSWIKNPDEFLETIIIRYRCRQTVSVIKLDKNISSVCIAGLENGCRYLFEIITMDAAGNESRSITIYATPDPTRQAEVPAVTARVETTGIRITWQDPPGENIPYVSLTYRPGGLKPVMIKRGVQEYLVAGLDLTESYNFRLQTIAKAGNKSVGKSLVRQYDKVITIPDKQLENLIRTETGRQNGPLLLSQLAAVTTLKIKRDVSDLDGLQYCINLSQLDIDLENIQNIFQLTELSRLKKLVIQKAGPERITTLPVPMDSLERLALFDCRLAAADLLRLAEATALTALYIKNTTLDNIDFLAGFRHLRELTFFSNNFSDEKLAALEYLRTLQKLEIINNYLMNLSFLKQLTGLQTLVLFSCFPGVEDTQPLTALTRLQNLDLSFTQISSVRFLTQMPSLQRLILTGLNLTSRDLAGVAGLTGLRYLDLSFNSIADTGFSVSLTSLQTLKLSFNNLAGLSSLSSFFFFSLLDLSNTTLQDVHALTDLPAIGYLNLANNSLTDISWLAELFEKGHILPGARVDITNNNLTITPGSRELQIIKRLQQHDIEIDFESGNIIDN